MKYDFFKKQKYKPYKNSLIRNLTIASGMMFPNGFIDIPFKIESEDNIF
jgi:hypothetical protein